VTIELELQIASSTKTLPHPSQFREWVSVTLWQRVDTADLTIRIVDEEEMIDLNEKYRHKVGPTNVLSFPYDPIPGVMTRFLGDIVLCAQVIENEAQQQNIPLLAHWAHMVVHGALHLLGYDHQEETEALAMQGLETDILLRLGFQPPYGEKIPL
jgi:probable rRNA maturation factor